MIKYSSNDPLFPISVASRLVKLHPRSLMLYEKSALIKPHRTSTGRRYYSPKNLEEIKFIHYLASQKNLNLIGIKLVLEIIEFAKSKQLDLYPTFFSDFKA